MTDLEEKMDMQKVYNILPDELNFNTELNKGTRQGYSSNLVTSHSPAQGAGAYTAGQALSWNIPISVGNFVMSDPEIEFVFRLVLTESTGTPAVLVTNIATSLANIQNRMGFNSFPCNRAIQSCTVKMNGVVNMSSNPAEDVNSIQYSLSQAELQRLSMAGCPDNHMGYSSANITDVLRYQKDSYSWSRGLDIAPYASDIGTNSYASNAITVYVRFAEKLMARPFQFFEKHPKPFTSLNNLGLTLNLASDLKQCVAVDQGTQTIVVTSCTLYDAKIRLHQFTPHPNAGIGIPRSLYYNAPIIEYTEQTASSSIGAGASLAVSTNPRAYNVIPKLWCVYAYTARTANANTPNQYYPITNLVVNNGIKKNQLLNFSPQDLFELSRRNGYNGNASMFFGGSPLNVTNDLGDGCFIFFTPSDMDSDLYAQSNAEANLVFNVTATILNHTAGAVTPILRLVSFTDAVLNCIDGVYSEDVASISASEMLEAKNIFMNTDFEDNHVMGGSFWSWLKGAVQSEPFKALTKVARNYIPVVKDVVGDNTEIGQAIKNKGYGKGRKKTEKGGGLINLAGSKMTQSQLMKILNS